MGDYLRGEDIEAAGVGGWGVVLLVGGSGAGGGGVVQTGLDGLGDLQLLIALKLIQWCFSNFLLLFFLIVEAGPRLFLGIFPNGWFFLDFDLLLRDTKPLCGDLRQPTGPLIQPLLPHPTQLLIYQ